MSIVWSALLRLVHFTNPSTPMNSEALGFFTYVMKSVPLMPMTATGVFMKGLGSEYFTTRERIAPKIRSIGEALRASAGHERPVRAARGVEQVLAQLGWRDHPVAAARQGAFRAPG